MSTKKSKVPMLLTSAEIATYQPINGQLHYNTTTNKQEIYEGGTTKRVLTYPLDQHINSAFRLRELTPQYAFGTVNVSSFTSHSILPSDLGLTGAGVRLITVCCSNANETNIRAQSHRVEYNSSAFLNITASSIEDSSSKEIIKGTDAGLNFNVTVSNPNLVISEEGNDDIQRVVITVSSEILYTTS